MNTLDTFEEVFAAAFGGADAPYDYQRRIAEHGFPTVLSVPTGAGKTAAAVLPWVWRRRLHPDPTIRASTPRRLVLAFPMRVLVQQTFDRVSEWLRSLNLESEIQVHMLMGGEPREQDWRRSPTADMVLVGTIDMLLSRALNRAYGDTPATWTISFGLLNNDTHWVFDEVQLMGAALPTSRQLQAFRDMIGTGMPTSSTWMSATVDPDALQTVDYPEIHTWFRLTDRDHKQPALQRRLDARKTIRRIDDIGVGLNQRQYEGALADAAIRIHRQGPSAQHGEGPRTIVVCNTVKTAQGVYQRLHRQTDDEEVVLLHSRFRPEDRERALDRALRPVPTGPGRIVVTTQVLEAGVDVSSWCMILEACPWPSVVQRAGRCNRAGEYDGSSDDEAQLWWCPPRTAAPYDQFDVDAAIDALTRLEGRAVTAETLTAVDFPTTPEVLPTLRRSDFIDLFDTSADLSGGNVDVSRYIRDSDDIDVHVAWVPFTFAGLSDPSKPQPLMPARSQRCPAPIADVREKVKGTKHGVWSFDYLAEQWRRVNSGQITPGMVLLMHPEDGCYDPEVGWEPKSKTTVPIITADPMPAEDARSGRGADPLSQSEQWVLLRQHHADAAHVARRLVDDLVSPMADDASFPLRHRRAIVRAAALHDLGKTHEVFQTSLVKAAGAPPRDDRVWAKSPSNSPLRHARPGFRHELVSALILDAHPTLLDGVEDDADLVTYLVLSHHGKVRLSVRSHPEDWANGDSADRPVMGVKGGDVVPAGDWCGVEIEKTQLDPRALQAGNGNQRSWTARALALRDAASIGPFRLGFAEALVRLADWLASADPGCGAQDEILELSQVVVAPDERRVRG